MTALIAWSSVGASILLFLAGLIELGISWKANSKVRTATDAAAKVSTEATKDIGTLEAHAAIDFKGQWEALAALATALKDLDRSTRFFVLSLAFLAVATATVGIHEIAEAIKP